MKQIEDIATGNVLYTFANRVPVGDLSVEWRDATATIAHTDYGYSPFGDGAAPFAPLDWPYTFRIMTKKQPDVARDQLTAALTGNLQRLVWHHDGGYERVMHAHIKRLDWLKNLDDDFFVDAKMTWKQIEPWHERNLANLGTVGTGGLIVGQSSPIILAGSSATVLSATPTNLTLDASVAGPGGVPTTPDTTMVITINGPFGGDVTLDASGTPIAGGIILANQSIQIRDFTGGLAAVQIEIPVKLAAGQVCRIDCGAKLVQITGMNDYAATGLKIVPLWQPYWFLVKPGVVNGIAVTAVGANPVVGGSAVFAWARKFK